MIGERNLHSSKRHRYILTATDYFTRWSEAIPLKNVNDIAVIQFLEQHIITKFGMPSVLVFDNASYLESMDITEFALEKGRGSSCVTHPITIPKGMVSQSLRIRIRSES